MTVLRFHPSANDGPVAQLLIYEGVCEPERKRKLYEFSTKPCVRAFPQQESRHGRALGFRWFSIQKTVIYQRAFSCAAELFYKI